MQNFALKLWSISLGHIWGLENKSHVICRANELSKASGKLKFRQVIPLWLHFDLYVQKSVQHALR